MSWRVIEYQMYLQFIHALPLLRGLAMALAAAPCLGVSAIMDDRVVRGLGVRADGIGVVHLYDVKNQLPLDD